MTEFWEDSFRDKQAMWGFDPANSAVETADLFSKHKLGKILIPGFGYGRNAKVFIDNGLDVTGIEISKTAIDLARKHYGEKTQIYYGSVTDMPFDNEVFDGVFCYALIHLLNEKERVKLIKDCHNQLESGGYMVFVAISKKTGAYGQGQEISKDTFLTPHGVKIFYYDAESVDREFSNYNLLEAKEITEKSQVFWLITCKKA